MAYSQLDYTGDGVTKDFNVTFAYLDQSHVVARINKVFTTDVASGFNQEFIDSTTLRVTKKISGDPPDIGDEISIIRQTPIDTPAVVFGGGASLSSANLNKNSEYLTYALQEATDANDAFTKIYLGAFATVDEPATDNDGDPLQTGASYFNTTENVLFFWNGSAWKKGDILELALVAQAAAEAAQTAAETAQTGAQTAETGALAAQVATEAVYDAFDDRFLGAKASEPALDNDGNALQTGALFFDTTAGVLKVYNGAAWTVGTFDGTRFLLNDESDVIAASEAYLNLALTNSLATGYSEFRADSSDAGYVGMGIAGPTVNDDGFDEAYVYTDQVALRVINQNASGVIDFFAGGFANSNKVATINGVAGGRLAVGLDVTPGATIHAYAQSPILRSQDSDGTNQYLDVSNQTGVSYLDSRNDASNGLIVFRGYNGTVYQNYGRFDTLGRFAVSSGPPSYSIDTNGHTDGMRIPVGTTAQRPTGANGVIRYNSTDGTYEGYNGSSWGSLGGAGYFQGENGDIGAASAKGDIFRSHEQTLNTNVTIAGTDNSMCAGPLTIASGVTLTVSSGGNLVIA